MFCIIRFFIALVRDPPPVIVYGPANQTLAVGSPAFLPCQATGRSPTFIKWFKDDQMVHFEDNDKKGRFNQSSTGSLRISELRLVFLQITMSYFLTDTLCLFVYYW